MCEKAEFAYLIYNNILEHIEENSLLDVFHKIKTCKLFVSYCEGGDDYQPHLHLVQETSESTKNSKIQQLNSFLKNKMKIKPSLLTYLLQVNVKINEGERKRFCVTFLRNCRLNNTATQNCQTEFQKLGQAVLKTGFEDEVVSCYDFSSMPVLMFLGVVEYSLESMAMEEDDGEDNNDDEDLHSGTGKPLNKSQRWDLMQVKIKDTKHYLALFFYFYLHKIPILSFF